MKAVVITGAGGNFCSGGDVHEIIGPLTQDGYGGPAGLHPHDRRTRQGDARIARSRSSPRWTASAPAPAPSSPWPPTCASARRAAKIAFLFMRVGLAGCDMGACAILPRIIGQGRAAELLYTGRVMTARRGRAQGLLQPPRARRTRCWRRRTALARELADGPTFAHAMTKRRCIQEWAMSIDRRSRPRRRRRRSACRRRISSRAYDAFVAKRKPVFEGN